MLIKKRNANLETYMETKAQKTLTIEHKCIARVKKREDQYVKAYRRQMKKADHDYYPGVHTSDSKVDGKAMGPFETKYESMKKSLLIFTEMGAINDGLATFIDYIAEHASPRIAGRWDVQGAWCNRYK